MQQISTHQMTFADDQNGDFEILLLRFVDYMKNFTEHKPDTMEVSFLSERSIEDEVKRESEANILIVIISYLAMFLYIVLVLGRFHFVYQCLVNKCFCLQLCRKFGRGGDFNREFKENFFMFPLCQHQTQNSRTHSAHCSSVSKCSLYSPSFLVNKTRAILRAICRICANSHSVDHESSCMIMTAVFTSTSINFVVGAPDPPFNFALVLPSFPNVLCHQYIIEHLKGTTQKC